jgi:hypothetical protein
MKISTSPTGKAKEKEIVQALRALTDYLRERDVEVFVLTRKLIHTLEAVSKAIAVHCE